MLIQTRERGAHGQPWQAQSIRESKFTMAILRCVRRQYFRQARMRAERNRHDANGVAGSLKKAGVYVTYCRSRRGQTVLEQVQKLR
jgi:hypothetical protein